MGTEKGVIIAAFKSKEPPRFVVLKRKKNWEGWELPKGHLEDGDYRKTVKQELREEAGIDAGDIQNIEETDQKIEWSYEEDGEEIKREYKGFIVEISELATVDITGNPHEEHEEGFFLRYRDVSKMLTYEGQAEFLEFVIEDIRE